MKIVKSIGSVVAGFLVVVILSTIMDRIMEGTGLFPSVANPGAYTSWMYVIALIYRTVFTVLAGYVAALIAPENKMLHVWILAIIGFLSGTLGAILNWGLAQGFEWYPISLAVLAIPSVVYGGYLKTKRYK